MAVAADHTLAEREEYAALIRRDDAAIAALGLPRVALALAELFAGVSPEEFAEAAKQFVLAAPHPTLGRPFGRALYQPMLELLDALRGQGSRRSSSAAAAPSSCGQ